jgi:transmembrane sensor
MSASDRDRPARADGIAEQAALWLARRDRGLSPPEQDAYIQWLTADPRHAEELARHAAVFQRMMRLYEWQPGQSTDPNPDLFAPRRRWKARAWSLGFAAAAFVGLSVTFFMSRHVRETPAAQSYLRLNESRLLPDGSIVELKEGSGIEVEFSNRLRRIRLTGEAHFTVAKDTKPFVVEAGNVAVRALGTVFNVRLDVSRVDVLVTEGSVYVDRSDVTTDDVAPDGLAAPGGAPKSAVSQSAGAVSAVLVAGQSATVARSGYERPRVSDAAPAEIESALGWQTPRLQFLETPLAVAVAEFNQRNRTRLVLGESELGKIPIGGTFRVDNVEGFVRLLEATLDIQAEPRAGGRIILSRRR